MGEAPANKVTFFRELEKLESLTDDNDESGDDFACILALSKRNLGHTHSADALVSTSSSSSATLNPPRSNTAPRPSSQGATGSGSDDGMAPMAKNPALRSAKTMGALPEGKTEGPPCKRRRTYAARTIPGQQQVFKGLVFC